MRTSNPAFTRAFGDRAVFSTENRQTMTVNGAINKTGLLLGIMLLSAGFAWNSPDPMSLAIIGGIGGIVFALITIFRARGVYNCYTLG